jgi:hypothetical protein
MSQSVGQALRCVLTGEATYCQAAVVGDEYEAPTQIPLIPITGLARMRWEGENVI